MFESIVLVAVGITAILGALGLIWSKVVKPIAKFIKRGHEAFERLMTVERYAEQLTPNSGSHVADSINRIETSVDAFGQKLSDHIADSSQRLSKLELDRADIWKSLAAKDVIETATHTLAVPAAERSRSNP